MALISLSSLFLGVIAKYTVHVLWIIIRVHDGPSTFIYLFICHIQKETIRIIMYHIIIKFIIVIVVIKIDEWTTNNRHMYCRTGYVLYYLYKSGGRKILIKIT